MSQILEDKRDALRSLPSVATLVRLAGDVPPPRGFLARIEQDAQPVALIAEIKKASPSRGTIVENFDPRRIATDYEEGGASCLSVLTDEKYFQGSSDDLAAARNEVGLPVLRKDFIVDERQVYESRAMGADCILLIVAALELPQLNDYCALARELGMDTLIEVHDEREMEAAGLAQARLIGINNRDLATFETDLGTTVRLAPYAPQGSVLVSESGIWTNDDVLRAAEAGAKAVLVGESLVRQADIPRAVRELLGR
ncbi:MAG: indole-3-glycerol phosphate synthase TrpC [Fimbriimonadales bacterium]